MSSSLCQHFIIGVKFLTKVIHVYEQVTNAQGYAKYQTCVNSIIYTNVSEDKI